MSLKASDIARTVEAYRSLAGQVDYPLHIGITEAGTTWAGTIKSAIGLGSLLYDGIGDTLRVSLTGDPVEEDASDQGQVFPDRQAVEERQIIGHHHGELKVRSTPGKGANFCQLPDLRTLPD